MPYVARGERIVKQLGMSQGRAASALRKGIMFSLAQKTNLDFCYRCSQQIKSVDEFSIDHKLPWEGISTERFWDLDNIAFSHMRCNAMASRKRGAILKCPPGLFRCYSCKKDLPPDDFYESKTAPRGRVSRCIKCCTGEKHWRKRYPISRV